jgi:hypothetical protein
MKSRLSSLNKNKEAFGSVDYVGADQIGKAGINGFNFQVDFDNLLKLRLAIEAASLELNQYNKNQIRAKKVGVNLFFTKQGRITVTIA